jgi:hypothetical protein
MAAHDAHGNSLAVDDFRAEIPSEDAAMLYGRAT